MRAVFNAVPDHKYIEPETKKEKPKCPFLYNVGIFYSCCFHDGRRQVNTDKKVICKDCVWVELRIFIEKERIMAKVCHNWDQSDVYDDIIEKMKELEKRKCEYI